MRRLPKIGALLALLVLSGGATSAQFFGKNKITYENFKWHVYQSPHFNIHYYPAEEPFLEDVVSFAESAYLELSKQLDHELRFRVPLVIYKTHGEFQQTNISLAELPDGVAAFAEPIQNRMVLPIDLPPDQLYKLISHELVHIFQYSMFFEGYIGRALRANVPTWLMEGMASYFADDESSIDEMAIRDAVVNNILPSIRQLNQVTFLTYRYGHAIFDFIEQEHGKEGVRNFLFEFRKVLLSGNIDKAIKESFGYDVQTFNRRFDRFLRKKYFPVLLEKKSPDEYGTEIGTRTPGIFTMSPTISPSGELIAALSSPKMELDLMVFSAEGQKIKNLTKGWTNRYRYLISDAFEGKRDLSWSPVTDEIAVFARREKKTPLLIYHAIKGKLLRDIVFDDIVQCSSPAFSPDGRRVAFEGNRDGVVDIFEIDLETEEIRNLTQDDFFDANPWYAQDGKTLLYNRRIGSHWKIFSVDVTDPSKKTQLTVGAFSDIQPSYSRDGETIYFSSDRNQYGIYNIYSLDLATGDVTQYTDVVGGCFAPTEMAERGGEKNLVFGAFFEGTFRLFRMPLTDPEETIEVADRSDEITEAEPFEPPLTLRVDEMLKKPYKLKWDIESPFLTVGVSNDGTVLANAAVQFADLLGNHRIQISIATVADFASYVGSYQNYKHRYTWGTTLFDLRTFFLRGTGLGDLSRDQGSRTTGGNLFVHYPFNRNFRLETTFGLVDNEQAFATRQANGAVGFEDFGDTFATVNAAIVGDTVRYQRFGAFQGRRLRVGTFYGKHLDGDFPADMVENRLDFRTYKQLTRRSVFAWRIASIYNVGERENSYGFGGLNQLRGFDFREFAGSRLGWMNLEFRFPLIENLSLPFLNLGPVRGLLFFDVGAAWFQDDLWFDPELGIIRQEFLPSEKFGFVARPIRFDFWDSEENRLQDGRASYGWGFQFRFIGLQFNWVWANALPYTQFVPENLACNPFNEPCLLTPEERDPETQSEFYIAFDW
jgi:Tol biopolymer transport system component